MDRDPKILQCILDLTDWWDLHMTSTPGTTQRSTEWTAQGRSRGSGFKVVSTVPVRGIPVAPQLETIRRFLANSLLVELKSIHVVVTVVTIFGMSGVRDPNPLSHKLLSSRTPSREIDIHCLNSRTIILDRCIPRTCIVTEILL